MLQVIERSASYWRVVINHPPLNLLDAPLLQALGKTMTKLEQSAELAVVVFESGLPDYFMAHQDFGQPLASPTAGSSPWSDFTRRLETAPFATIGLVRGRARGAGNEFLLALDMRFASRERALLGQPELGMGLLPGGGALERLAPLTGRARALEAILGAEDFSADTAERYGWVNQSLPDEQLDGVVDRLACRLARFGRPAIAEAKRIQQSRVAAVSPAQLVESEQRLRSRLGTPEARERLAAMFDRGLQQDGQFERNLGSLLGLQ